MKRKRKVKTVKNELRRSRYSRAEIIALIRFLMVLLQSASGKTSLTKAQRKSLAITESQLGIRVKRAARGKKTRRSGVKSKKKKGVKTARQKRFAAAARRFHGKIPKGTKL